MCGIFGGSFTPGIQLDKESLRGLIAELFILSEARGKEAAGLAVSGKTEVSVFKSAGTASKIIRGDSYAHFFEHAFQGCFSPNGGVESAFQFVGHSRLVTNGLESDSENNQPVTSDKVIGVHNGILVNDKELAKKFGIKCRSEVDTEVLLRMLDKFLTDSGDDGVRAIQKTFTHVEGSASLGLLFRSQPGMLLATNTGSLSYLKKKSHQGEIVLFASEGTTLEAIQQSGRWHSLLKGAEILPLKANRGVWFGLFQEEQTFSLVDDTSSVRPKVVPLRLVKREVWDGSKRPALTRCSVCILPETFPFIEFDDKGVCGFCRAHTHKASLGEKALRELVEPFRSKSGDPDCIVAFSGGRDSSYGLHYLKNVLGLNPIAFTYDWGMVTDLARRNQARICGKLGIEHVVRAADIPQKRRFIRLNIEAWMKRPHLGMIPLFMAGDKQFYHYARALRKERGIDLAFFCGGNEFEQTHFKSGFCGVRENNHGNQLTHLNPLRKLQMAAFYLGQYLRNPGYWNASLPDTIWAYYSFYIAKDDFSYLYHYIPWNEAEIEKTLLGEYKWETANDTKSTWRIGDGTAAFYNYIYYTVAGFSEHDTFRSHQIRAGLMTRAKALELVERDNLPRFDSIQQYAELVGFNCNEVLRRINEIPKLWQMQQQLEPLRRAS